MDYRVATSKRLSLGLALRALSLIMLTSLAALLLTTTELYATSLIVVALIALFIADIVRVIGRANRHDRNSMDARASDANAARDSQAHPQQIEYLQTLLDTVSAALIIVDSNGGIRFINRASHRLFKGTHSQLRDIVEFDAAAVSTLLSLAPGARQIIQFTDGRHLLCTAAQFSVPGRAPERLISLQRLAGELDAVEVKAWQDLARVVAHEMMNSLTPIASLSESLETQLRDRTRDQATESFSDEVARSIEAIRRRSFGLMNFIDRYRRVADLPPPVIRKINVARLIADIERLVNAQFERRKIRLSTRVEPPDATVPADSELLEHAIINLLQNAADATEHTADAQVTLDCMLQSSQFVITVADNGVGLPERQRDRLLLPFFSTKPDGSGIGLALVRHIALAHQGQVEIRNNEPCGAVVSIVLPVPGMPL